MSTTPSTTVATMAFAPAATTHPGQRCHGVLEQILPVTWDTESWVGQGTVLHVA